MSTDRKEYQRQYYLKKKANKKTPEVFELVGCIITYLLSLSISINSFQQFSTGSSLVETWIFFASIESLIFFLSFNTSQHRFLRVSTSVVLTLGLNFIVSKGAYDDAMNRERVKIEVERDSTLLKQAIQQLDLSITGFQEREMHTKAVELLEKKSELLTKLNSLAIPTECSSGTQVAMIIMRVFISLLNITVVGRIGFLLPKFFG